MFISKCRTLNLLIVLLLLIAITSCKSCNHIEDGPTVNCSSRGSSSIFVANFDGDAVGSIPAPSTPLHYGPPGASLNMQGGSNTIEVVNSAALGSYALKITRGQLDLTKIFAVVGDVGDAPYTTGVYYIEFRAHGEVIPSPFIAGMEISVRSTEHKAALILRLYDGSYHLREGDSYVRLNGSYEPSTAHFVHIELNLDTRKFSICIDDEVVASYKAFLVEEFLNVHSLQYFVAPTITEAFQNIYIVDEIRIMK